MSKVFCDICGTAFPESAQQCPICGNAKPEEIQANAKVEKENAEVVEKATARGGHFSNANVRKRNKASSTAQKKAGNKMPKEEEPQEESNRGLIVVAWVLLVAMLLVLAYIVVQFVVPMFGTGKPADSTTAPSQTTTAATTLPEDPTEDTSLVCTGLSLSDSVITLDAVGRIWLLEVTPDPVNTTDVITFKSADEAVATVGQDGRVTAVAPGETMITVTCGGVTEQCKVVCAFAEETTEPATSETTVPDETEPSVTEEPTESEPTETEPTETEPTEPEVTEPPVTNFGLFEQDDVTLVRAGESFYFESGDIYLSEIVWSVGNPAVATVENGVVTAVGPGVTIVRGEYNGQVDECIIRCDFEVGEGNEEEDTEDEGGSEDHPEWPYLYPSTDVSIAVGESFELTYVNSDGEWPSIEWSSDNSDVASVDGDWVTGVGYGVTTVRGYYDGVEITCIVRVVN